MGLWREFTKRRQGIERFVVSGLSIAIVGAGMWVWGVATNGDPFMRTMGLTWVVVGLLFAGIAVAVIAYRKRDRADS